MVVRPTKKHLQQYTPQVPLGPRGFKRHYSDIAQICRRNVSKTRVGLGIEQEIELLVLPVGRWIVPPTKYQYWGHLWIKVLAQKDDASSSCQLLTLLVN